DVPLTLWDADSPVDCGAHHSSVDGAGCRRRYPRAPSPAVASAGPSVGAAASTTMSRASGVRGEVASRCRLNSAVDVLSEDNPVVDTLVLVLELTSAPNAPSIGKALLSVLTK